MVADHIPARGSRNTSELKNSSSVSGATCTDALQTLASSITAAVSDTAYDASSWNGVAGVAPSKNAVRDKIEAMATATTAEIAAAVTAAISDTAYDATSWNSVTGVAPSKNAVRDKIEVMDAAILEAKKVMLFGTGVDGDITYSTLNSRWEDGSGSALSNGSTYDGVGTTTLVLKVHKQFQNVTVPVGCTLQLGESGTHGYVELWVSGTLTAAGTITSGYERAYLPGVTGFTPLGSARKTTAGAGTVGTSGMSFSRHGQSGGSGAGGGDGTNVGGAGMHFAGSSANHALSYIPMLTIGAVTSSNGTTTAGAAGANGASAWSSIPSTWDSPWMCLPGCIGAGGASGALKVAGGTNRGGAGGDAGLGRKPVRISAYVISFAATTVVHADGQNGSAGEDGIATNAAGDISGGGGGGSGASGGPVAIRYGSKTDLGATIRSTGGTGGNGGLGYEFNGSARASSNGGNGGNGSDGIVIQQQVI